MHIHVLTNTLKNNNNQQHRKKIMQNTSGLTIECLGSKMTPLGSLCHKNHSVVAGLKIYHPHPVMNQINLPLLLSLFALKINRNI